MRLLNIGNEMILIESVIDMSRSDLEPLFISDLPRSLGDVSIRKAAQEPSED